MSEQITPEIVTAIDSIYTTPIQDYESILEYIKTNLPDMEGRKIANFASHFLTGFFEVRSKEWRMANALMANVYYYHYASLMNNPIDESLLDKDEMENKKDGLPNKDGKC